MRRTARGVLTGAVAVVTTTAFFLPATTTAHAAPTTRAAAPAAAVGGITETWHQDFGSQVVMSSPTEADLNGQADVVVGDAGGNLQAFDLGNGGAVAGFPASTGSLPVYSSPSVDGVTLFVGTGYAGSPTGGAYKSVNNVGQVRWSTSVPSTPGGSTAASVATGLSVGNLQGINSVVSGALGQQQDELNAASGAVNPGFPWFEADTNYTTPAIADLYGNGQNEIIEGGDSTAGNAYNRQYANGGHIRVLSGTGNAGTGNPAGGLNCNLDTDEVVQGSPAVGNFLPGSVNGIVAGTGTYYAGASTEDDLIATNSSCQVAWETKLNGATGSSPALVDALGNGALQIAEGTDTGSGGSAYLLNGSGGVIWSTPVAGRVIGSIVSADLGAGYQDLIVPTIAGAEILDGKTGAKITTLFNDGVGLQDAPLVTDDPNGTIGITVAGYTGSGTGEIVHYEVGGSNGSLATEKGAWPEFHHDPQLTGDAGTSAPVVQVKCSAPPAAHGYDLFASDGGVFNYGNAAFCGSTGNLVLNAPVTSGETTKDLGGYWEVATDGGVFAFGDATFLGAASSYRPAAPIVGIAATADGRGYWEVGSDGGLFAFGDATFYGSAQPYHPRQPIVGMATTPDGKGYWLVASDGGIFAFGDARFNGSAGNLALARPVVGMAPDAATGGYWLVASDGGIFSYGAPFLGSEGGVHLTKPMVGIDSYAGGAGYRTVASDGGVFAFHATFYGSAGNLSLTRPVVGLSSQGT